MVSDRFTASSRAVPLPSKRPSAPLINASTLLDIAVRALRFSSLFGRTLMMLLPLRKQIILPWMGFHFFN